MDSVLRSTRTFWQPSNLAASNSVLRSSAALRLAGSRKSHDARNRRMRCSLVNKKPTKRRSFDRGARARSRNISRRIASFAKTKTDDSCARADDLFDRSEKRKTRQRGQKLRNARYPSIVSRRESRSAPPCPPPPRVYRPRAGDEAGKSKVR